MPASRYDIIADQGSTFKLWMEYKYLGGTGIDLSNFQGDLQVRRSQKDDEVILYFSNSGVTGGGVTGEFTVGVGGIAGVGGISFNTSISGGTGYTGGIFIRANYDTMKNVPQGKHFYDLKLTNTLGEKITLLEGAFEIPRRQITRT
jgi:hypothetical protein